jgi:hypothetical protein
MPHIHDLIQGSEAWENIRKGKATASRFADIITPRTLKLSASHKRYAAELVAERHGIEAEAFMPTYWMDRGSEYEQYAIDEFTQSTGLAIERVGFVTPEIDSLYGCSPDGFVGKRATIQVKCPKAETLIKYRLDKGFPDEHLIQCQGELWVTGRESCHFYCWHPQLEPLHIVLDRDDTIIAALEEHVQMFLELVETYSSLIKSRPIPRGFQFVDMDASELHWSNNND